ncbi:MAG: DHH family phosphoesterase [Nanoarchaeota archaeon]
MDFISRASKDFCEIIKEEEKPIRIISHIDTDGITSVAILAKCLKRLNLRYWITNLKRFDAEELEKILEEAKEDKWNTLIILDFGLDKVKLDSLNELGKNVFILDHHIIPYEASRLLREGKYKRISLVNQRIYSKDEISTAGLAYLFCKVISRENKDLAYIALIGILGDLQKIPSFCREILEDAVETRKIIVRKGIQILRSRLPLQKALEYSDFYIPDVSNSQKGSRELLRQANIPLKEGRIYRTFIDLTDEEILRLVTLIAIRTPVTFEELIGEIYLINIKGTLYSMREIGAIVNSCGRVGRYEEGIEACYGKIDSAEKNYTRYRKELLSSLRWIEKNIKMNSSYIHDYNGALIINARNNIRDTLIGVTLSMINPLYEKKVLVGLAYSDDNKIKVSLRSSEINSRELLERVCHDLGCEYGGHERAAGCLLEREQEDIFINRLLNELR